MSYTPFPRAHAYVSQSVHTCTMCSSLCISQACLVSTLRNKSIMLALSSWRLYCHVVHLHTCILHVWNSKRVMRLSLIKDQIPHGIDCHNLACLSLLCMLCLVPFSNTLGAFYNSFQFSQFTLLRLAPWCPLHLMWKKHSRHYFNSLDVLYENDSQDVIYVGVYPYLLLMHSWRCSG